MYNTITFYNYTKCTFTRSNDYSHSTRTYVKHRFIFVQTVWNHWLRMQLVYTDRGWFTCTMQIYMYVCVYINISRFSFRTVYIPFIWYSNEANRVKPVSSQGDRTTPGVALQASLGHVKQWRSWTVVSGVNSFTASHGCIPSTSFGEQPRLVIVSSPTGKFIHPIHLSVSYLHSKVPCTLQIDFVT